MLKKLICLSFLLASQIQAEVKVLAFSGSTREDSYNKKLLQIAVQVAKEEGATVKVIDLRNFSTPLYDGDLEDKEGMPKGAQQLRALMVESDAIIIAAPEYNASVSAVLKNALDWVSRAEDGGASRAAFKGKKFAIMSASLGRSGGARGLKHLRAIIEDIGGTVVVKEVTVPRASEFFDNPSTDKTALRANLKQEIDELLQGG